MGRERGRDHRAAAVDAARNGQRRRQIRAEIAAVLLVRCVFPKWNEGPPPPLDVMIPGNHENGRCFASDVRERATALEFAVACALRKIAADDDGVGPEIGEHPFQRLDDGNVGQPTEVDIADVRDLNRHDSTWMV